MTATNESADARGSAAWCVLVLAQFHGRTLDAAQVERMFGAAEPSAETVASALRDLGFEARLVSASPRKLKRASMPAVIELADGSFAIAIKANGAGVAVQRPGEPRAQAIAPGEFKRLSARRWVEARPAHAAAGAPERFGIGWFLAALGRQGALMGEVMIASLFIQVFALVTPLVFQIVIDKVLAHRSLSTLDVLVIALAGVAIFEIVLGGLRSYLFSHTSHRIDTELGAKLYRHLLRLPLAYFESRRVGDTVARVRELENVRHFLTGQAATALMDLAFVAVFLAVMFYYSTLLTLIVVVTIPILFGVSFAVTPLLRGRLEDRFALSAENQAFLVETVAAIETVKGQAIEPRLERQWKQRLGQYMRAAQASGNLANVTQQAIGFLNKAMTVLLLWLGAKLVMEGSLTVGQLIAFNMLAGRVSAPILRISQLWQEVQQMKVSMRRLAEILDVPAEPHLQPGRMGLPPIRGSVAFEHVSFRYRPDGPEVLADVSFTVGAGERIAIVGPSGSGKTTLVRLLQRLYVPERGRVLIDGVDVALADAGWLRSQLGVVAQDSVLFNRSVRDNITLGDPTIDLDRVVRAARLAGAHEFVLELPEGYDTEIGERGSKLSGGQRARLAIARALAADPRILILDEATANLDYESERRIQANMRQICAGRTVFVIAHRLSTVRFADRFLVLDRGRLVEQGRHADLLASRGRYASLYRVQEEAHATA